METMESTAAPQCWPAGSAHWPSVSNPPQRWVLLLVELEDTSRLIPWSETPGVTWDLLTVNSSCPLPCPVSLLAQPQAASVHLGLQKAAESSHRASGTLAEWE